MEKSKDIDTVETTKPKEELAEFSIEPDWNSVPSPLFSKVDFVEKKDHLLIQIALPDVDLSDIKITASGKTLILRIHREKESNFIRVISLPTMVNFEQGKADFSNNILTIGFPILSSSREIEIQHS